MKVIETTSELPQGMSPEPNLLIWFQQVQSTHSDAVAKVKVVHVMSFQGPKSESVNFRRGRSWPVADGKAQSLRYNPPKLKQLKDLARSQASTAEHLKRRIVARPAMRISTADRGPHLSSCIDSLVESRP